MRRARLPFLAPVALLVALLVAPTGVLAAEDVTVTGTVMRDGAPVTGVEVVVAVAGSDQIASATTDEAGAFSVQVQGGVGTELEVFATGQTSRSEPDAQGCVMSETPVGRLRTTIDALPPAPLVVELDEVLTGTVCSATATPGVTPPVTGRTPRPRRDPTPPATDAVGAHPARESGNGILIVLAGLALIGVGSLALARRRT